MKTSDRQPSKVINPKTSRTKKILIPIGIILFGGIIFVILSSMAPKPAKHEIIKKAPLVDAVEVKRGNVVFEIESQGSISPRTTTTLVSEVSGQIKKVSDKFVVGGFFNKGEQILEIDPISYEVALLQAQARLDGTKAKLVEEKARAEQAEKEWGLTGRNKKNAPILALRKPQLQQAKADVKAAEADVKSAQIKLDRTKIIAPYDAMLKAKMVDIGQYVSTGTQLATTFAVDYAEVRLPIKEHDIGYLDVPAMGKPNQKGSQVELTSFQAGKVKRWSTFITRSEGVVDETSRVNYVIAQIDDPYGLVSNDQLTEVLPIGTFVNAKIIGIENSNIIAIPRKALRGANKVYMVGDDRKLDIAEIDILRSDSKYIYIIDGLQEGSHVVLTKLATAIGGMSLRLKGDPEPVGTEVVNPIEADGQTENQTRMAGKGSPPSEDKNQNKEENQKNESNLEGEPSVKEKGDL